MSPVLWGSWGIYQRGGGGGLSPELRLSNSMASLIRRVFGATGGLSPKRTHMEPADARFPQASQSSQDELDRSGNQDDILIPCGLSIYPYVLTLFFAVCPLSTGRPLSAGRPLSTGRPLSAGHPLSAGSPLSAGHPLSAGSPLSAGLDLLIKGTRTIFIFLFAPVRASQAARFPRAPAFRRTEFVD